MFIGIVHVNINLIKCPQILNKNGFLCCIEYISPLAKFELTTLVAICTDYINSCKSNYHMITTTTAPT